MGTGAARAGAGGTAWLPFDLSDQYTGWLRVRTPDGDRAVVQAGWSGIAGWSFMPTDFIGTPVPKTLTEIENAAVECRLPDLIAAVQQNRDAVLM